MTIARMFLYLVFVGAHYLYPSHYNAASKWCGGTYRIQPMLLIGNLFSVGATPPRDTNAFIIPLFNPRHLRF